MPDSFSPLGSSRTYGLKQISKAECKSSPFEQFHLWLEEALKSAELEPTAMSLATVSKAGLPSSRTVLLKESSEEGLTFFTNYESQKAKEIDETALAAIHFFWSSLERQVCMRGKVERLSREKSAEYFASRNRGSQLGAWASRQSQVIRDRASLDSFYKEEEKRFEGKEVPLPPFWGGFLFKAHWIEFWQGRSNRLHDRIRYRLEEDGKWKIERLCP